MPAAKQSFGGAWTVEKLERIRKYLAAYVQILKGRTSWCEAFIYIDAFAGTGYNSRRSTTNGESTDPELLSEVAADDNQKFLDGSARIALQIEPSFTSYHFIEKSTTRAKELEKLKAEFPHLSERIFVTSGDANEQIQQFCRTWDWSKRRAVLFLDPFGMQVSWSTIVAIARTGAIDMWLLFPAGIGVNRMLPRHGDIPAAWRRRLDDILGVPETVWYPEFFKPQTPDLFAETPLEKTATIGSIGDYFIQRLRTVFNCVASSPLMLRNDSGTPLYLLCFASKNKTAVKIANHLLKTAKPA